MIYTITSGNEESMRNHINRQFRRAKRMRGIDRKKNEGFSLIEVLVAMVILALMTMPMLTTFATSAKVNAQARKTEEANAIGQKVIERCKALSIDELLDGHGDAVIANANAGVTAASIVNNPYTGVYDAKAQKLANGHYLYNLTMASYTGTSANKNKDDSLVCYKGSNDLNYYVQTVLSPNKGDSAGSGAGTPWTVNDFSMPAFAEVKDSSNYVLMRQLYEYDTSIKTILPSRSSVVNPASTDASGNVVIREQTSTENNVTKLSGIKKVVVLDVEVEFDTATNTYNETPVLYIKYYRENTADGTRHYHVNNRGEIIDELDGNSVVSSTKDDVFIKKHTLTQETGINFTSKNFKDIYIFYSAYDRKYGSSGNTASDSVYINMNKSGGTAIPDGKEIKVFLIEQYVASNDSSIEDRDAFRTDVQIKLDCSNIYINGAQSLGTTKLKNNGMSVFSDVNGWGGSGVSAEPNNITQDYKEDEERYLYTITVNIWVEENGVADPLSQAPYLTLTSTKEN